MKLLLAKHAGFCYGVSRAVQIVEEAAQNGRKCRTLGPIIHNEHVVKKLANMGVEEHEGAYIKDETIIIRSHGVAKSELDKLREQGIEYIDATCPHVSRIHKIVADAEKRGRLPIIIGAKNHPEITAIAGWCHNSNIFENMAELRDWLQLTPDHTKLPLTFVSQTTNSITLWQSCSEFIKKECTNYEIFDTICSATENRQVEAKKLSEYCDGMIVIGDKNSSNTQKLARICSSVCEKTVFVGSASELDTGIFASCTVVGITAGASTPAWIIKEVCQTMSDEFKVDEVLEYVGPEEETAAVSEPEIPEDIPAAEPLSEASEPQPEPSELQEQVPEPEAISKETEAQESADEAETIEAAEAAAEVSEPVSESLPGEESFEELLEKSIKTLYTGEKVTGVITAITPSEIQVDLGAKQSGYIPIDEFSDDPEAKVEDLFKVGDEIETYILRVNDVEGTVKLSKKRLDSVKTWDDIEAARENRTIVEGFVTEENKGGVVANVRGIRVFIPASQTGLGKDVPMSSLLKTKVRMRITEVNKARRRVVGTIRAVQYEERREKSDKVWAEIEDGMKYTGVVKSLTSYGAFVDIGGVDGMVHISELSWNRIKHPSEVIKVGDAVEVYVISADKEKKKISLGYKTTETNPWNIFVSNYMIGDVVPVKIVKLMTFGAFAEVIPGVDGLIHISQIADRRIGKPEEVLSEGQQVNVRIIDIDAEKQKISLSIRVLIEEAAELDAFSDEQDEIVASSEAGSDPVYDPSLVDEPSEPDVEDDVLDVPPEQ